MGDLEQDTRLTGGDGRYEAALSADWEIWGPNGGYVAAVLQRAAGAHTDLVRPASIAVTFLAVGRFEPVVLTTRTLRRTRRAECVGVSMAQGDRPVAEAIAWYVADGLPGIEHDTVAMPDVPPIDELRSSEEVHAERGDPLPPFRFFDNFTQHPPVWHDTWPPPGPLPPTSEAWIRFRPTATFDDPSVDAGRLLIVLDTFGWPAVHRHHAHAWPADGPPPWTAPSLDLHVRYHRGAAHSPALYVQTHAPLATEGLVSTEGRVWTDDGLLAGSMSSALLSTPTSPAG